MKKSTAIALLLALIGVTTCYESYAADCWLRDEAEEVSAPPGAKLQPGGYICLDQWSSYVELEGGRELVRHRTGERYFNPFIQDRPVSRLYPRTPARSIDNRPAVQRSPDAEVMHLSR